MTDLNKIDESWKERLDGVIFPLQSLPPLFNTMNLYKFFVDNVWFECKPL